MKAKEELNALKADCQALSAKLNELSEEELCEVTGGSFEEMMKRVAKSAEGLYQNTKRPIPSVLPVIFASLPDERTDTPTNNEK